MKRSLLLLVTIGFVVGCAPTRPVHLAGVGNTSWQLVKFQGGDGTVLIPDDMAKYTVAFANNGDVSVRFDCNRGRGVWILNGPNQLRFGPLSLTRAVCPPGSLHDHLVRQWPFVQSYSMKGGHLFLSLMANGGIYEFGPIASSGAPSSH
jgi:para-nitrobenzyl esterase